MNKTFTWHCGASVLVDDAYAKWDVKAGSIGEAMHLAVKHLDESKVLDEGTLTLHMDAKDLARELGNLASEEDSDWMPYLLTKDIEKIDADSELYNTLEWIVCNANKKGEILW